MISIRSVGKQLANALIDGALIVGIGVGLLKASSLTSSWNTVDDDVENLVIFVAGAVLGIAVVVIALSLFAIIAGFLLKSFRWNRRA
jgi:hypothetical protein